MRETLLRSVVAALCLAALAACGEKKPGAGQGAPAEAVDPQAAAEADQVFSTRCATCHGASGVGDGQAAAALNPKPRNFHDQAWQKSVDDAHIEKTIVEGGQSVGKSPAMAPNPDLKDKPAVVKALRAKVRAFGK